MDYPARASANFLSPKNQVKRHEAILPLSQVAATLSEGYHYVVKAPWDKARLLCRETAASAAVV